MRKFYVGIDVGTSLVKVVIAAPAERSDVPMLVLGTGTAPARGMRHGYVVDTADAARSIREAALRAAAAAKIQLTSARISLGGVGLEEVRSSGDVTLTTSGGVVTEKDIDKAISESVKRASSKLTNRTVIHSIPLEYRVDGTKVFGKPQGLQGTKLVVDTLLITLLTQHYDDMIEAVEAAGIEVEGVMASPLAASLVTLSKAQKMAGVCLATIGAETLSLIVFDGDVPISVKVFPVGSADITNSLALTFQIPLNEAESLKRGGVIGSDVPVKKIDTIISARLKEMFTLVNTHLKAIGRQRLLPAGIVISGGGSGLPTAVETARTILKLPSQTGQVGQLARSASMDPSWAVSYGLCRWGFGEDVSDRGSTIGEVLSDGWDAFKSSLRSLLP